MEGVSAALADLQHTLEEMTADALRQLDTQTAVAARWPGRFRVLAGLLAYCVAALLVLTAMVLRITVFKPVRKLQRAARAIARGRFAHRIEHGSGDEFGEFAEAFNSMAESLQHRRERTP
jgi:nitrate/nitrite-specific signal transduction histidine kinase